VRIKTDRIERMVKNFKRDWQLHLLILFPSLHFLLMHYGPMYGIQIAFRDYRIGKGIVGSEWVGLKWFIDFLSDPKFMEIFMNTLILSLYEFLAFPIPIILALLMNSMRSERYKKTIQTIGYIPHFISVTVFVAIINMLLSPVSGIYGNLYSMFGGKGYPSDFKSTAEAFRHIYVWSGVWQGAGWGTIIYTSALSGVSVELHEAARVDGASRFKRLIHIDLPSIMPTVAIQLLLRIGSLIGVGFDKTYLLQTSLNLETSEVISTYVFKKGFGSVRDVSYSSAIGLFNTIINLILLLIANYTCNKITEKEVSLF